MPIEQYFQGLEEIFILTTKYPPGITMALMAQIAKTAMEKFGLFQAHVNERSIFTALIQDWGNMKSHFGEAYKNLLISGRSVSVPVTIAHI